jgi:hypothetical protein
MGIISVVGALVKTGTGAVALACACRGGRGGERRWAPLRNLKCTREYKRHITVGVVDAAES